MPDLRSYVYLDRLQPQFAAYIGANARGYIPIPGMAAMLVEVSPGVVIHRVIDAAVKAANIRKNEDQAFYTPLGKRKLFRALNLTGNKNLLRYHYAFMSTSCRFF